MVLDLTYPGAYDYLAARCFFKYKVKLPNEAWELINQCLAKDGNPTVDSKGVLHGYPNKLFENSHPGFVTGLLK